MINRIWRFSHLVLALVSTLFLVTASVTGVILAFEPINQSIKNHDVFPLEELSISNTIDAFRKTEQYEVINITVTKDNFVTATLFNEQGEMAHYYVHPKTGELLEKVIEKSALFQWVTNLHRSLFLKGIGRFFIGFTSLLLCFIAITGLFLLLQRQGGLFKLFSRVRDRDFNQRYHVVLGRLFLLPIIIIAGTGLFLCLENFNWLPQNKQQLGWQEHMNFNQEVQSTTKQNFLLETKLSKLRKLNFPFSTDESDYYEIELLDREVLVHQYTGEIVSEVLYPFTELLYGLSLQWHTGQGSILWSVILAISSASLLFFIFSGISIYIKRQKIKEPILVLNSINESEFILLVGSEFGNTYRYASAVARAINATGEKVAITTLNEYSYYPKAEYVLVFTSTYGDGDPPSNARMFEKLFYEVKQTNQIRFSVVGFGSLDYPKFCHFARKIDGLLHSDLNFIPVHPIVKINEQSCSEFEEWIHSWNKDTGMNLKVSLSKVKKESNNNKSFIVIERTALNIDNTSLLRLRPKENASFQSGDLFNVVPPGDSLARQYSIAKIDEDILLSIKWKPKGICSTYLCTLKKGDIVLAGIQENINFHFPKKTSSVWLISNGTGIAPFLGMLDINNNTSIRLTWGGRSEDSFDLYREIVERSLSQHNLNDFKQEHYATYELAFSQGKAKKYVQDLLSDKQVEVAKTLSDGGVFMLCGSKTMQNLVINTLKEISKIHLDQPLSDFEKKGQLLMDCY